MRLFCAQINIYREYLTFYLKHGRMIVEEKASVIHNRLFHSARALAPNAAFEDFEEVFQKHKVRYEERILADIIH